MDIHRPPFLRSQSDNSSTTTIIASHLRALDNLEHGNKGSNTVVGPRRPPRNPARTLVDTKSNFEAVPVARALTGTKEEVTPWELEPFPANVYEAPSTSVAPTASKRISIRPTSSGGHSPGISFSDFYLLRRKSTGSHKSSKAKLKTKAPTASSGHDTSNSHTVLHKQRVTSGPGLPHSPSPNNSSSPNLTTNGNASPRLAHKITSAISSHPLPRHQQHSTGTAGHSHTAAPPSSRSTRQPTSSGFVASQKPLPSTHAIVSKPSSNTITTPAPALPPAHIHNSHPKPNSKASSKSSFEQHADHQTVNNIKFSTADRTILEELKRNISAREAQFIIKGPYANYGSSDNGYRGGHGGGGLGLGIQLDMGGLGVSRGRKHHPFKKEEVPYPRSYDREVLDLDVWESLFCQQICESLTWHVFEEPPTKVLDIGCGTGSWILDCARMWRKCHFVGMDIVPLQPDLQQVNSADLAHRVTWIQGNLLEGLPFPNEEFDFVHIKRISLGVPEDKWDFLFEEISRVMKPGAAFEMIEEDLLFPGATIRNDEENESAIEDLNSQSVDVAYFTDSDIRHHSSSSSSSSYFAASGSETRNRPRSTSSAGSTSTTTDVTKSVEKSTRRRSVPVKGNNRRRSTNFDYATLTSLMGLNDGENEYTESEREDERHHQEDLNRGRSYGSLDRDSLASGSRRNSFVGERMLDELIPTPSSANHSAARTSPIPSSLSPLPSPSPSSPSLPTFLTSPINALKNVPSIIATPMRRGIEADAIVEDEEGEENAILDSMNDGKGHSHTEADVGLSVPSRSHSQYPTDSTITPTKIQHSQTITISVPIPSNSTLLRHPLSASTGSLTDLQPSPLYASNPYAKLNSVASGNTLPPKRPLSANNHGIVTNSNVHLPSMSFSQSIFSVSSNSPRSSHLVADMSNNSQISSKSDNSGPSAPFLLRTLPKPPVNPRDHSMLEMIYNEMNAARFVNLSPLSLLPNLLGLYFKDLRTHPPVIFTFPPMPVAKQPSPEDRRADPVLDIDQDPQDAIRPSPSPTINSARSGGMTNASDVLSYPIAEPALSGNHTAYSEDITDHWINIQRIGRHESPYIIYDGSRLSALSPLTRASILSSKKQSTPSSSPSATISSQPEFKEEEYKAAATDVDNLDNHIDTPRGTHDMFNPRSHKPVHDLRFRLPNTTMNIDLRSLNLHLALRATEILACSETMWEWVMEHQEQARNTRRLQESKARVRSQSIGPARPPSRNKQAAPERRDDQLKAALAELTREEFDDILRRFYLDMQDYIALPTALSEGFGWTSSPGPPSAERKTFEAECEKFQQWEAEQHQRNNFRFLSGQASRQRVNRSVSQSPVSVLKSYPTLDGLPASHTETRSSIEGQQVAQSVLSAASTAPPSRRISRSLRIFVAWKGFETL